MVVAVLAGCLLAGCQVRPAPPGPVAVRADLVLDAPGDDPSLVVAQYREWDADGRAIGGIELDHGHGPAEEDDEDDVVVIARVGGRDLPIQAVDAVGDRVVVDLDALPPGRHTLRLAVVHEGQASDTLDVAVLDRRVVR